MPGIYTSTIIYLCIEVFSVTPFAFHPLFSFSYRIVNQKPGMEIIHGHYILIDVKVSAQNVCFYG